MFNPKYAVAIIVLPALNKLRIHFARIPDVAALQALLKLNSDPAVSRIEQSDDVTVNLSFNLTYDASGCAPIFAGWLLRQGFESVLVRDPRSSEPERLFTRKA
ncbi:hypothetical protein [Leptolyngbya sp. FACHB-261]|uniref:hypothetical protein n=1 Tax=Leptolyngbya sp. FACHB-261 TaxID=2692806 RepID=UPI0016878C97|nr:hypothetical protein [Leptolyngbya sp. FACHB-261]MBD2101145.1 hypothetical protein [Leptolyngbya sp. FACHB-261]